MGVFSVLVPFTISDDAVGAGINVSPLTLTIVRRVLIGQRHQQRQDDQYGAVHGVGSTSQIEYSKEPSRESVHISRSHCIDGGENSTVSQSLRGQWRSVSSVLGLMMLILQARTD